MKSLQALAYQKNLLANLVLFAESEQSPFGEVQIITLAEYAQELALGAAYTLKIPPANLEKAVTSLTVSVYNRMKEFVLVDRERIRIGVHVKQVDDHTIDYAMGLLLQLDELHPGQKYEFGKVFDLNVKIGMFAAPKEFPQRGI